MKIDLSPQLNAVKQVVVRYWPKRLGRLRTSTVVLMVAFVALFWVQQAYRPATSPPQVVPPGFVPDPDYTWVPRTNVAPQTTSRTTPPTTTTTTEETTTETTTPETTTTSPRSATTSPRTTVISPGMLPPITLPVLPGIQSPANQQPSTPASQG